MTDIDIRATARRWDRHLLCWMLFGVAIAGLAAVVIRPAGPQPALAQGKQERALIASVHRRFAPLPQDGRRLGIDDAAVKITIFADLQSPRLARLMLGPMREMLRERASLGQVQLRFRSMPGQATRARVFMEQQAAALAAGRQDRLWQFVSLFIRQQADPGSGYVTGGFLRGLARQAGLDVARFERDRRDPALLRQVARSIEQSTQLDAQRLPVLVVEGPRGTHVFEGVTDEADLSEAYDRVWH